MSSDLLKLINNMDTTWLGEELMNIAEGLLYKDANIAICKITFEDLNNENFDNIEKLDYYEYGDWDNLSYYVSAKELERIKKQFEDDLQERLDDEESDVDTCFGISSCFLYCNDRMNDKNGYDYEYKDFVWCATD
tara:strand:+ start:590 stop:994 length:405 start_codon:yes stop_codon:yes gene_type:complete